MKPRKITAVVPVFDNAATLEELSRRILGTFDRCGIEGQILFVDDSSSDSSLTLLRALCRADPRVGVIALERNLGQNHAILAGLCEVRNEWTVILDADLQDPPEAMEQLVESCLPGVSVVFATRQGRYQKLERRVTSWMFHRLRSLLSGVPIGAGLYLMIDARARDAVIAMGAPSIVAAIGALRLPFAAVPVARRIRFAGVSAYSRSSRLKLGIRSLGWLLLPRFDRSRPRSPRREFPVKERMGGSIEREGIP